jgi:hypothetical protein
MWRGFLSTILGSFLFSVAFLLKFEFDNDYSSAPTVFLFAFILGMFFSFFPAILGGYLLAIWLFNFPPETPAKIGAIKGAVIGATCMFAEDFLLGVLSLPMSHGPSLSMFLFYVISSVIIASLMGALTGVKLANVLLKYKVQENPTS